MTEHHVINPLATGTDYEALAERFRPIFTRIAAGALEREQSRSLPFEPIQWLKEAGFGAVRVPPSHGRTASTDIYADMSIHAFHSPGFR